ncbi:MULTISPECIES: hypothetical protein [Xanthomonas]|uniref:Uncharacterized protein n=1 Tax=Xanthomonas arboricola TaxID=56448 RepID=A0AB73GR69_9XANT|nr:MULTISPECIES: hypothetical protein [Xanthomonas]MBB5668528.1 hypothetical protein [Xanthomonas arboricola]MCC8475857.1 hypothetical protein [Xanthomonas arboricola]
MGAVVHPDIVRRAGSPVSGRIAQPAGDVATEQVECAASAPRQNVGLPLLGSPLRSLREADEKLAGGVLNAFQLPGLQWQGKEKLADAQ